MNSAAIGFDDPTPGRLDPTDRYDDDVIGEIGRLVERQERINDLALRAQQIKFRARAAVAAAKAPPKPQPSGVRRLAWRAKRRLVAARSRS